MVIGLLSSPIRDSFTSYVSKNIVDRSLVVFLPPWYDFLGPHRLLIDVGIADEIVDLRVLSLKYHRADFHGLVHEVVSLAKRARNVYMYPEAIHIGYRGVEREIISMYNRIRESGLVIMTRDYSIYDLLTGLGYPGYEFREFGMGELYRLKPGKVSGEILYLCEGNLGVASILKGYGLDDDMLLNYVFDYYSFLESGQRRLLYYLSTRTFATKVTKVYGAETYVFLKRLMDRGVVYRFPGRGNYLVRDPLLRMVFYKSVLDDRVYRVAGWLYLFVKVLLGARRRLVIETATGRLILGAPIRFRWLGSRAIRLLSSDERTYTIYFVEDTIRETALKRVYQYDDDIKVLLATQMSGTRELMSLRKQGIFVVTPDVLSDLIGRLKLPRRL